MRSRRGWVGVVVMLGTLSLAWSPAGPARAAKVFAAYTVRMEAWARPTVPGAPIDVATMMLGDDVRDLLTIMVVQDANGVTPTSTDLQGFCTKVAGFSFPMQTSAAEIALTLPADLESSLGYGGEERWGSSVLICSRQDDAVSLFALLSSDPDVERTQALLTRVAREALTADPPDAAAGYFEIVARRFGRDLPLTDLPGSAAIPAAFQVVATDVQVGGQ